MYLEDCLKALDLLGSKLVQIYGQGGTHDDYVAIPQPSQPVGCPTITNGWPVGTAQHGVEVRVDEDDNDMPLGEIGEILQATWS